MHANAIAVQLNCLGEASEAAVSRLRKFSFVPVLHAANENCRTIQKIDQNQSNDRDMLSAQSKTAARLAARLAVRGMATGKDIRFGMCGLRVWPV